MLGLVVHTRTWYLLHILQDPSEDLGYFHVVHCKQWLHHQIIFKQEGCYNLSPNPWYLLALFLLPHSCSFRYVFLQLGSLPNPLELIQLFFHWTLTLRCSPSTITGQGYIFLLISAYCVISYLRTASPSNQFYRIGYMFLLTHICSLLFYDVLRCLYSISHSCSAQSSVHLNP